ncbi:MAG: hypothetical protein V9H69_24500 [Anaerolineae bacterium]
MKNHRAELRKAGGALAVLIALAALVLLSLVGGHPQPAALAQPAQSRTSTPTPPFTSPLQPPTPTRRAYPSPFVPSLIDDPVVAAALWRRDPAYQTPESPATTPTATPGSPVVYREISTVHQHYLPLSLIGQCENQYAGRGFAVGDGRQQPTPDLNRLNRDWYFDWDHQYLWAGSGRMADMFYVPMVWCADRPGEVVNQGWVNPNGHWTPQELTTKATAYPGKIWLIYNEPDHPWTIAYQAPPQNTLTPTPTPFNEPGQCARVLCRMVAKTLTPGTPEADACKVAPNQTPPDWTQQMATLAADRYAEIYRAIKAGDPTAKVYCCGQFYTRGDLSNPWWTAFLARLSQVTPPVGLDGVHIHTYPVTGSARNIQGNICGANQAIGPAWWICLENALRHYFLGQHECATPQCDLTRGKPLLVTEYGYLGVYQDFPAATIQQVRDELMQPILTWLIAPDMNPGYDGVAWFVTWTKQDGPATFLYETSSSPWGPNPKRLTELGKAWACPRPSTPTP